MKLGAKVMLSVSAVVVGTTLAGIGTVYFLAARNRVNELRGRMSSVLEQSEVMAENMDAMYSHQAFDVAGLLKAAESQSGGRPLRETYRSTAFYSTIPIVASWQSVERAAKKNAFDFFTPSRPGVAARNPKNANGEAFAAVFKAFAEGRDEYFFHDRSQGELILARPVRLKASCLSCHGEASPSTAQDGKDPLGFAMEGLKLDEIKGAFVLKARMTADPVVRATVQNMARVGGAVLAVVLAGFHFFNRRQILKPLEMAIGHISEVSAQTASAAREISAASQGLAEGASEQAASLEETSASLEEMSSMTKRNAEHAQNAKEQANQTRAMADAGAHDMEAMSAAMDGIKASNDNIARIIKTIDEIAFQTNILALNAAVEAAHAGQAGAGFAVVADEVRSLARRSAQAAKETASIIEDSITKGQQGVQISAKVAGNLKEIVDRARRVDELVAQIATASQEQSQGIQQVTVAVTQMDTVTQGNAASAEESASAAEELNSQATVMNRAVAELRKLVHGAEARGARAVPSKPRAPRAATPTLKAKPSAWASAASKTAKGTGPSPGAPAVDWSSPAFKGDIRRDDPLPLDDQFKDF